LEAPQNDYANYLSVKNDKHKNTYFSLSSTMTFPITFEILQLIQSMLQKNT